MTEWLRRYFSWNVLGNLSSKELGTIFGAGSTISNYINGNGGNGEEWIKKNLGETIFVKSRDSIEQANRLGASAFVWPYNTIGMNTYPLDSATLIHELGHVLDNNQKGGIIPATVFGGGPADKMVSDLGGHPELSFLRMKFGKIKITLNPLSIDFQSDYQGYHDTIAGPFGWNIEDYANNGVSDDFANTFRYTITGENSSSPMRISWMNDYISKLGR